MRRLRGSIQKLGKDRWRVFATVRDDEGHPRKLTATVAGSRMDAEAELERLLGTEGMRRDRPFSEVVALYLAEAQRRVEDGTMAESTLNGYRQKATRSILPALGRVMVSEVTPARVQRFLGALRSDAAGTWRVLRTILNWAHRNGYVAERVCDRVEPVRQRTGAVGADEVYTADEAAAILSHSMEPALKTAVVIALSCGLRRGEICALTWDDYDGETIFVRRSWGKETPKTPNSVARLIVPQWARDYLDPLRGDGLMVGLEPNHVTEAWRRLWFTWNHAERDGAPPVRYIPFKNLRHTSLTMVYEATHDIKATSRRGRHASTYITERFYVRASDAVDRRCADALDEAMGAGFTVSR